MRWLAIFALFVILAPSVLAYHVGEPHAEYETVDKGEQILSRATAIFVIASIIIIICTVLAMIFHEKLVPVIKWTLFLGIAIPTIIATVYSAGSTIYLNQMSETGGPVHWHADFEIWACENKLDLIDPTGMTNRVGTPVLHEHNDDRMHVEGVLVKTTDASLARFFQVIGGLMTTNTLAYPTNEELVKFTNGELCPDGTPGKLQVFRWYVRQGWLIQDKIVNFPNYVLGPYSYVPDGDCLIIEFGPEKQFTDKLCTTYRVALEKGDIRGR